MKKIALTGNMGTGKSYVSRCLQEQGIFVLDMDACANQIRKEHHEAIKAMFAVNEEKEIAHLVFQDDDKRQQLESYLYPFMIQRMEVFFQTHAQEKILVVEVPLLFEKGWEVYFDEAWCVASKEEVALQRLMQYRHISKEEAKQRLAKQDPIESKIKKSHHTIYNNEKDDVHKQIQALLTKEGYAC